MKLLYWLGAVTRGWLGKGRQDRHLDAELDSYLDMAIEEKCRQGLTPEEARRQAVIELGGVEVTKERVRESRAGIGLDRLWQDLRFGLRLIRSHPGFSLAVLLTLALGVGANSAIYSLGEAVLFRSAPVQRPAELVGIWTTCRRGDPHCSSSYPDYLDYRDRSSTLEGLAAYSWESASLGSDSGARVVSVQTTSGNYFSVLGVSTLLGRPLQESDDQMGTAPQVVVLSHRLWNSHFGANPGIVGQTVQLNRRPFEVVGVTLPGFEGLHLGEGPDLYIPLLSRPVLSADPGPNQERFSNRGSRWIAQLVGRRQPGTTLRAVRLEMAQISDQLATEDPQARGPRKITVESAEQFILPVGRSQDLVGFIFLLAGIVGMTLLLACANLSNLLLARGLSRQHELGIRVAIGASRFRLVRQQITETLLLAMLGGVLGLFVASLFLELIGSFELPGGVPISSVNPRLNPAVVLVTFGITLLAGLLSGLVPALQGTKYRLARALVQGGGRVDSSPAAHHLRRALVGLQLALSLVLLVGTGLFLDTLRTGLSSELGFRPEGLVTAEFDLSLLHYSQSDANRLLSQLEERVAAFPGVSATGAGTRLPLKTGGSAILLSSVQGYIPTEDEELRINYDYFRPGFVSALGIRLIAGETLDQNRAADVILINQVMAERWWPDRNPVGGVVQIGESSFRVAGVIENTRWRAQLEGSPSPFVFFPFPNHPSARESLSGISFFARTSGDENALMLFIRDQLRELDRDLSANALGSMKSRLSQLLMPQEMAAILFTGFGCLGLLLAAVGIYGITSFSVARRAREIGVRVAVGASKRQILSLILRQFAVPLFAGLSLGILLTQWMSQSADAFLLGDSSVGWPIMLAGLAILVIVAFLACIIPASRALRGNPLQVLRAE